MRVLVVSAELSPFVRTGGLGDAVAGLSRALAGRGHDVTVAIPGYRDTDVEDAAPADGPWRRATSGPLEVLLFDDDEMFGRPGIYGPKPGTGYEDNWMRFGRFVGAAAQLTADHDVAHFHDAHTGAGTLLSAVPSVFTIHNAAHPVLGPLYQAAAVLGLGGEAVVPAGGLEWYGQANYLKAGIAGATQVTTVSPGHAAELSIDETSFGLAPLIRSTARPIIGILNGIDAESWNPSSDAVLPKPFGADDLGGREASRRALLRRSGLDDGGMVFGNVGRMARQKGLGLLEDGIEDLIDEGLRLVLVGNGELDDLVDAWADRHPKAVSHLPYEEELARLVSAGCDAYLMPSQFEPCGLGQLYAMRYGAPPVVRFTGGLADSVVDVDEDPDAGTGLGFRQFLPVELEKTIRRAMRYRDGLPELWHEVQRRGMELDVSWDARASEYEDVYTAITG